MQIEALTLGIYGTNCYILHKEGSGSCVVIDPAGEPERLLKKLDRLGLVPAAVLLTHGHYDHILAVPALQQRWPGLPVYCHPLDVPEARVEYDMGQAFPTVAAFDCLRPLAEGQSLELAGLPFRVMHTPGHTPGSVTFVSGDTLFTGDTLFRGSIGRTDFEGGSNAQMRQSLIRLAQLPQDYKVCPGHEGLTTLDREKRTNPWLISVSRG